MGQLEGKCPHVKRGNSGALACNWWPEKWAKWGCMACGGTRVALTYREEGKGGIMSVVMWAGGWYCLTVAGLWPSQSVRSGCCGNRPQRQKAVFFFIMRLSVLIAFFLTLYIAVITLSVSGYVIYGLGHCSLLSLGNITAAKFAIIKSEARWHQFAEFFKNCVNGNCQAYAKTE